MSAQFIKILQLRPTRHLKIFKKYCSTAPEQTGLLRSSSTSLPNQLRAKIKAGGPLTIADYMKEVLINPASGYYTQHESIGTKGDFITSPEICQIFGEMIAVWILNEWQKVGSPKPMQLVELGPGKGTLIADILRVFQYFKQIEGISVHLVELSSRLQDEQARKLCSEVSVGRGKNDAVNIASGTTDSGHLICWHNALTEVPRDAFSCVVAHEFFDALPIHKFKKTNEGWREILIDIDPKEEKDINFRYVLSRHPTPACKLFAEKCESTEVDQLEVCADGGALLQQLATRFEEDGGFLLMADYGHDGASQDSFRGFKSHKLHDPLKDPGSADLTADVDFSFLRKCVADKALTFGPVTQKDFLFGMGIDQRLEMMLKNINMSPEEKSKVQESVRKLTHSLEMGERFKFFAMFPQVLEQHLKRFPVAGFC